MLTSEANGTQRSEIQKHMKNNLKKNRKGGETKKKQAQRNENKEKCKIRKNM